VLSYQSIASAVVLGCRDKRYFLVCDVEVLKEVAVPSSKPVSTTPSTMLPFVVRTIAAGRGSQSLSCPDCQSPLNLIQPDENKPTRLLGTCDTCSKWAFLVELEPEWQKLLLIELPDGETIRRGHPEIEALATRPSSQ
jgi:hypothetical protein